MRSVNRWPSRSRHILRLDWLLAGLGAMSEGDPDEGSPRTTSASIPVIDRVQAGGWAEVQDPYAPGGGEDYLSSDARVGPHAFALVIEGDSMTPEFRPGDKVIIDPTVAPRPGEYVVAKRHKDQRATFKKYRLRGQDSRGRDMIELVPLNLDWPTLVIDADNPGAIIGTMVEHRRYRRE